MEAPHEAVKAVLPETAVMANTGVKHDTLADVLRGVVAQNLLKRIGGGRVAALEILVSSPAVANLIREGKMHQIASSMQTGKAAGTRLLNDSLADLVSRRVVDSEEALSKAVDKAELAKRIGQRAG